MASGTQNMTTDKARLLSTTGGTTKFWRGDNSWSDTLTGTLILNKTTNASGTANNSPALIVGGAATSTHLELDANEVMAKGSGTTTADIYINADGNAVILGKASNGTNDYTKVRSTANATSTTSGALRVDGGIGVAKAIYMGGQLTIANTSAGAICMTRSSGPNWIWSTASTIAFCANSNSLSDTVAALRVDKDTVDGYTDNYAHLGSASVQWKDVHSYKYIVNEHVTLQWNSTDSSLDFVFA